MMNTGMRFPAIAKRRASYQVKSNLTIAQGMANRNSPMGIAAIPIVAKASVTAKF